MTRQHDRVVHEATARWKRWRTAGHYLQAAALIVALVLVFVTVRTGQLQDKVDDLRRQENYFMVNNRSQRDAIESIATLTLALNQLELLSKLTRPLLPNNDTGTIRTNKDEIKRIILKRRFEALIVAYIQTHDPAPGTDPMDNFRNLTEDEITAKTNQYDMEGMRYVGEIKNSMINFARQQDGWKLFQNWLLGINSFLILLSTVVLSRAESLRDDVGEKKLA